MVKGIDLEVYVMQITNQKARLFLSASDFSSVSFLTGFARFDCPVARVKQSILVRMYAHNRTLTHVAGDEMKS